MEQLMTGPANTRFALTVHVLTLVADNDPTPVCSEMAAGSAGTNPVHVRRVMSNLRRAGIVESHAGAGGGWTLARPAKQISLADVWDAVYGDESIVTLHPEPNPACRVGEHIGAVLADLSARATQAARSELATVTLADVLARTVTVRA
jgi:Rrf2 family protein